MLISRKHAVSEDDMERRRLSQAHRISLLLASPSSVAFQTVAAYSDLLEYALRDVVVESQREHQGSEGVDCHNVIIADKTCSTAQAGVITSAQDARGGLDVFGQYHPPIATDQVSCSNCGRKLGAGRYAPHLEKCLGKGRAAGRLAIRRLSRRNS